PRLRHGDVARCTQCDKPHTTDGLRAEPSGAERRSKETVKLGALEVGEDGDANGGPVPEELRVFGDQAGAAVAAGDAEFIARLPVVLVQGFAVRAEVLRPPHVFDFVVGALRVQADQAAGIHRLVLDAALNRVVAWRGLPPWAAGRGPRQPHRRRTLVR